ncbi:FkbM family methyltransferase [Myxococcota bacterium]
MVESGLLESAAGHATSVAKAVDYLLRGHPVSSRKKLASLRRWLGWQVGSRLVPGPVVAPFVGGARLLVRPGMTGATGNIYSGLAEFEDMAFLLHLLSEGDLFVDIGANIGSYTVLASGVRRARAVAFEPSPLAFQALLDNVNLNRIGPRVEARNQALGAHSGSVRFTTGLDTVNHVATEQDTGIETMEVELTTLDAVVGGRAPLLIKIDVEGFEHEVIAGASKTLRNPGVLAVIMETNGSGLHYGVPGDQIHSGMTDHGFEACTYAPFERRLVPLGAKQATTGNTVYIRNVSEVRKRLEAAPKFEVLGLAI